MSDPATDTIAALATPAGRGGIGVLRLSGTDSAAIGARLMDQLPAARAAALRLFRETAGARIARGIALYFPAPNSFTG